MKLPFLSALLFIALDKPSAVPLYYSFEGEVVFTNVASHNLGQTVNYTFLVDQDLDGYLLDGNGSVLPVPDIFEAMDFFTLSFYSAYVGGDALAADNPSSPLKESSFAGVDQVHHDEIFSALRGSNADGSGFDLIDIFSDEKRIGDWAVGQSLRGENFVENGEGEPNSGYSSRLTLKGITEFNPRTVGSVPEPSAIGLFGLGLAGLGILSRLRRRDSGLGGTP